MTDDNLKKLLRRIAQEEGLGTEISPKIVQDYIHGRASANDQELVELAMARSGAVREEVFALAAIANRGRDFASLKAPPSPPRRQTQTQLAAKKKPFWTFRRSSVMAFCGLVAMVLVVWILTPLTPGPFRESRDQLSVSLDRTLSDEQFEVVIPRSLEPELALPAPQNLRDAALISFFQVLEWRDGEFLLRPEPPAESGEKEYSLLLELERVDGTASWPYNVRLPEKAYSPQTAILTLPDLKLYWVEPASWRGHLSFEQSAAQTIFLTVAYRLGTEYRASPPAIIPPP